MTVDLNAAWRQLAACRANPTMFDDLVEGETTNERRERIAKAQQMCKACPVAAPCERDIDPELDAGVRAGMVIEVRRGGAHMVPIDEWLRTVRPVQSTTHKKAAPRLMPREHGTVRGYRQHIERKDMPPCGGCKAAKSAANAITNARRERRKAA